ncbi:hypothetical protein [Roseateles sp. BYS96W]|uniref:Uncharacterized protein n=1 Tax=Pelomonas nitida TaxID=3299027 RepID=A0ABW7GCW1_9BURK
MQLPTPTDLQAPAKVRPTVLVLGLEGTLYTALDGPLAPRPFLFAFLEVCQELFDRIVVFPDDLERFRRIASALVDTGAAPAWFLDVECMSWDGQTRDLAALCLTGIRQAFVIDAGDQHVARGWPVEREKVSGFSGARRDGDLLRVVDCLQFDIARRPFDRNGAAQCSVSVP